MGSFGRPFYDSTPVLAIQPQPAHHVGLGTSAMIGQASCAGNASISERRIPALNRPSPPSPFRLAGRKRSRDEAAPNLADEAPDPIPIDTPNESDDDWEYGEGMVLIKRNRGYVADASSQSGTWVEEKAALESVHRAAAAASARVLAQERPLLRGHKSQRLCQSPASSCGAEIGIGLNQAAMPPSTATTRSANALLSEPTRQPVVDSFTMHLGIGWRRISDDEHIQAAARGWARYIENHYPVSSVAIRLESRGLQAYLVEATEGFYLFAEDLKQGRLVSMQAEKALQNLKASPPVFDGHETLFATETPGAGPSLDPPRVDTDMEMSC